ncbi:MAG TPA: hypothetical protein VFX65_03780 [Candidatus Limnocylindrales bacterium]|nr:hypothetical protein [Candidatus Limnocylindrales bacterium]
MGASTDAARAEVLAARDEVLAARKGLEDEVVRLEAAGRAAIDIPARLRREPAKVLGAAGGAAFLLLGGPKRLFRQARRAVFGPDADLPKSMLPKEVEKTLKKMGADGDRVRGTLEKEFTKYLEQTAPERRDRDLGAVAAALLANLLKPATARAGKELAERFFDPDGPSFGEGLRRARQRMERAVAERGPRPDDPAG